ncbi:MAG: hypothetical protein V4677_11560 [Bacteroidota bacterium]
MKYLIFGFILNVICSGSLQGQSFTHESVLSGINKDSLYKIPLTPEYKKYMSPDLHDLRIYDAKQKEVPYVVLSEPLLKAKSDFISYEIVSQNHFSTFSEIVIRNPNKDKISNIAFNINNSDAYKYCSIEGSNDKRQWYSVSELQELSLAYNELYTNQYKCIYFPLNDYEYFRLTVDDWFSHPLKINSAGCFKNSVIAGKLNEVVFTKTISEDAKNKKTLIHLSFTNNQQVDRIDFKINAPRLYMRHAVGYVNREQTLKHKTETYKEVAFEFDLKSDGVLFFDLPNLNEKELFIEIENKDNPPLEIESISCKQLASYLICDFLAGQTYTMKYGDKELKLPEYDLGNFVSQIPQLLPEATIGMVKELAKSPNETVTKREPTFFETQQFLWLCLGLGAIIIFLFSRSLLKDMKQKE